MKSRCWAEISLSRLHSNLKIIAQEAKIFSQDFHGVICMVKSNAYGHGIAPVSRFLDSKSQALGFGVASLEEALLLRKAGIQKPVWVFSDGIPLSEERISICKQNRFTIIIHSIEDLKKALASKIKIDFQLKFNTGLNRLGIDWSDATRALSLLRQYRVIPQGICSHLSDSDLGGSFSSKITLEQVKRFKSLSEEFGVYSGSYIHIANSGAVYSENRLHLGKFCNVIRPGIALYGYLSDRKSFMKSAAAQKLKPVLTLKAHVLKQRKLARNQAVGYGSTCVIEKTCFQNILSLGYGDGLHRNLSSKKILIAPGSKSSLKQVPLLGRVSMDLISIGFNAEVGSEVTLLGQNQKQGYFMAEQAETIIYELFTSISSRVPRLY